MNYMPFIISFLSLASSINSILTPKPIAKTAITVNSNNIVTTSYLYYRNQKRKTCVHKLGIDKTAIRGIMTAGGKK